MLLTSEPFFQQLLSYTVRQGLLLSWHSLIWLDGLASCRALPVSISSVLGLHVCATVPGFFCGCWRSELRSSRVLSTCGVDESPSQPCLVTSLFRMFRTSIKKVLEQGRKLTAQVFKVKWKRLKGYLTLTPTYSMRCGLYPMEIQFLTELKHLELFWAPFVAIHCLPLCDIISL